MSSAELDVWHMRRALELAVQGRGYVEPNPMVGSVVVRGAEIIGEGWHRRFGQAHAEIEALALAGARARGATMLVTLEPCCHQGKTPPCTQAIIDAGVARVVVAQPDPFPQVAGDGVAQLQRAGIQVEVGVLEAEARRLNAPYLKLVEQGQPWVIAKWAMTLDGKTATETGSSQWISHAESRRLVHLLRSRVDAIMVGRRTVELDEPLLTARPPGPRTALRIVVDTRASLSPQSQLVRTARDVPVLVTVGSEAPLANRQRLAEAGCEVLVCEGKSHVERLTALLTELGRRRLTNLLVEGGGQLLGSLLDLRQIDEVHVFIAQTLLGGRQAATPIAGAGLNTVAEAIPLDQPEWQQVGDDLYVHGPVLRNAQPKAHVPPSDPAHP